MTSKLPALHADNSFLQNPNRTIMSLESETNLSSAGLNGDLGGGLGGDLGGDLDGDF